MSDLTWNEAIKKVLEAEGAAMHYVAIAERIKSLGLREQMGANPTRLSRPLWPVQNIATRTNELDEGNMPSDQRSKTSSLLKASIREKKLRKMRPKLAPSAP